MATERITKTKGYCHHLTDAMTEQRDQTQPTRLARRANVPESAVSRTNAIIRRPKTQRRHPPYWTCAHEFT